MKKISVIIPFYKVEKYIAQCLDSVVRQTLCEIEILCVDDNSPDKSINIVKEYAKEDRRIRIFQHENTQGVGAARNTGIKHAEGEYIFFLDSDDWLLEESLHRLYETARKYKAKIVSAPLKCYLEVTGRYKKIRLKKKGPLTLTNANFLTLEYNAFKLFHKSIFENTDVRFPDRLIHEDVEFYWKVFTLHPNLYCLDFPVMVYRIRADSIMTSKKGKDYCNNNIELIKNIFNFLEKNRLTDQYRRSFTKEYYNFLYKGSVFDADKFSMELDAFFQEKQFATGFSLRKVRKWFFNKKFNKNERALRFFGFYLIRKKL